MVEEAAGALKTVEIVENLPRMKKIVLTGGPCSGKTTVLSVLREAFVDRICIVPEGATLLLAGGFPVPGKQLAWSPAWQAAFEAAVLPVQKSMEDAYTLLAQAKGQSLLLCDRGILDGAAYTPGGLDAFLGENALELDACVGRYHAVVHLESLAVADPANYGKSGNDQRFEPVERAREIELATRDAWAAHPRRHFIEGGRGIEKKIVEVISLVRRFLDGE